MFDYEKVSPEFWNGETGKALHGNPEAQVLAMYLLTSPHVTTTGIYPCSVLYMAIETGLSIKSVYGALTRLAEVGFCWYDEASDHVSLLGMAELAESAMDKHWFWMSDKFAIAPRVQTLSEKDQRRLVMLFCLNSNDGDVALQDSEVALHLRISEREWARTKRALYSKKLLGADNKPARAMRRLP